MTSAVFSRSLRCDRAAACALAVVLALAAGPALAQTKGSWNVNADGLWSGSSNWLNNTIGGGIGGVATFANDITATRTITLDTNRSLGAFVFGDADTATAASWIVSGSTMTMNNNTNSGTITVNALGAGATATISSTLAASGTTPSIIKDGVGTLVLGATNTFTTKLAITSGTLQVSTDRNLGAVGTFATDRITISNGAALRTTAAFTLSGSRGITIGSGGGTISANGGILTIGARLTGAGNTAIVTGSTAVTLTNTSGTATDVNWDFATLNGVRTFFEGANALGTGSVQVRNGVRLTSQSVSSGTLSNAVTLATGAGLTARSSGGALTYTNVIFPSAGTVTFNKDDELTSILTLTSGGALTGNLTIDTSQGGANAVGNVVLGGVFSGAGGLVKSGTGASGRVVLRAANTYTGTTTINTGTLQLGNGGTVGTLSPSSVITGSSGATLAFNRSDKISSGTDFNNVIGGGIGVSQVGSGTVVLSGSSTYTGATSITNGTLEISNNNSLGAAPGSFAAAQLQISNGATLRTTAAVNLGANRGITIGTGTATLNINGGNLLAGRFTGAGNTVAVTGSASLSLLTVSTGTADVNWDFSMNPSQRAFFAGSTALGTGSVRVRNGVRLTSQTVASGTLANAVTLDSGAGLTARSTGGDTTYTNVIFPSAGTVVFNQDDLATSALTITSSGSLAGDLTVDTSQGGANAVADVFLDGVFSGAGGLVKAGTGASGRLVLRGANAYTGNTTITTGTLQLGPASSIASSGTINVAGGASFDVAAVSGGFSLAAGQVLKGTGTVVGDMTAALGTIAPGSSPGTLTFANNLSLGAGSILDYELSGTDTTVGSGVNDLSSVLGDLMLDGTLNVTETVAGSFLSANVGDSWRLFNYTGTLTNNGVSLGSMPTLSGGNSFQIDTSTANQVNLVIVPEPGTIVSVLVGLGTLGMVAARRRVGKVCHE